MSCIMLHNLCIHARDPCNPRWQLKVEEVPFEDTIINRNESKKESIVVSKRISDWLWENSA